MNKVAKQLARSMSAKKEELLMDLLPKNLAVGEIVERCDILTFPDGTETYYFCGDPLIKFYPPEFETVADGESVQLKSVQNYKVLKNDRANT